MGDNNDEVSLTDVVVAQPTVAEKNELIAQLMQQIDEMRVEMQRRQDTPPPGCGPNFVGATPPIYFPSSNMDPTQNQPSTLVDNPTTFQVPIPAEHEVHGSELDHYEEQEREWKAREEAKIDIKEEIKRAMKELQCIPDVAGLSFAELCILPDLNLPKGFKILKFDTFGGVDNPMAHLRYYDQLMGVGKDEALLMRLFSQSLCGEALEWFTSHETRQWPSLSTLAKDFIDRFAYNVEIVPDRYSIEKMKQKLTESYGEFAYRWRKEAARVRPPMTEKEIVEVFVRVQEPEYYDRIILLIRAKFAEIVKVGETIEDGLKSGKIARVSASPGSSGLLRKKREEVAAVSYGEEKLPGTRRSNYRAPSPTFHVQAPAYQNPLPNCQAPVPNYQTNPYPRTQVPRPNTRNYQQVPPLQQSGYDPSRPRFQKRPSRNFTKLAESQTKLFERLSAAEYIHPVGPKPVDINSMFYKPEQRCAYHSNSVGHDTENCINHKHKIQDLIDQEAVAWVPSKTLVKPKFVIETAVAQGMTRSGRCYTPDELALGGQKKDHAKRPISEAEEKEFWRRMQPKDYYIVKHLEKTPA
ncbi:uncharacterized protein LOC107020435 [Solanum pennellii]|uniref:Uncharacterized protein LOC107020435 n=1 Tax=Solanum pennellii TaxID=28526 RepID=A0ABM1GUQ3_SOLPN|nr:uncharacterized protein LOC107020435 [Solanum pennellii]